MQIKHTCRDCGEVMEVHEHNSWLEIKLCDRHRKALCIQCRSWPGSPLPSEEKRGQEGNHAQLDS
jgi:hypothetical protein